MPESKKLSELIEDFVWKTTAFNQCANFRNDTPQFILRKLTEKIDDLKTKIDQKFEELKCSCEKHKLKEWRESLSLFEQVMESKKDDDESETVCNEEMCNFSTHHFHNTNFQHVQYPFEWCEQCTVNLKSLMKR